MELILLLTWDPVGNVCTRHKSTQGETVCKVTNTNRPTTFRSHKSIQLGLVWHRVYENVFELSFWLLALPVNDRCMVLNMHTVLLQCANMFFCANLCNKHNFQNILPRFSLCPGVVVVDANSRRFVVAKLGSE